MYRDNELLYCVPGTNIMLYPNCISKTTEQTHKKRYQACVYQRQEIKGGKAEGRLTKDTNFQLQIGKY